MTFTEAINSALSKFSTFSGRATRPEFWWWVLFVFIVMSVTRLVDGAIVAPLLGFHRFEGIAGQPLSAIVSLAILLPSLAVGARRLHDIGRTAWWLLLHFIPIAGSIVLLVFAVQPSEEGENQYG